MIRSVFIIFGVLLLGEGCQSVLKKPTDRKPSSEPAAAEEVVWRGNFSTPSSSVRKVVELQLVKLSALHEETESLLEKLDAWRLKVGARKLLPDTASEFHAPLARAKSLREKWLEELVTAIASTATPVDSCEAALPGIESQIAWVREILATFDAEVAAGPVLEELLETEVRAHVCAEQKLRGPWARSARSLQARVERVEYPRLQLEKLRRFRKLEGSKKFARLVARRRALKSRSLLDYQEVLRSIAPSAPEESEERFFGPKFFPSADAAGNLTGRQFSPGVWAFTYDDGPTRHTESFLKMLREENLPATFFLIGQRVRVPSFEPVLQELRLQGHDLQAHSWSHADHSKLEIQEAEREIRESSAILLKQTGTPVQFYRLPYGAGMSLRPLREKIAEAGLIHVFWNVDSRDWADQDPESIFERVKAQVQIQGRGVILFHDTHPQSVEATRKVLGWLRETSQQLRLLTVSQALQELNQP
jgi:peptidoglycan/xylan/chitin deacetylase (PgdA/CDA1 family)